jgi:hypothetical protein
VPILQAEICGIKIQGKAQSISEGEEGMITAIWTFIKNPKNLIITILAVLFVVSMGMILWQRASIATKAAKVELQRAEIDRYKATQKAYAELIDDYTGQVVKLKQIAEKQQVITNATAKEVVKIKYIKSSCKLEGNDAKIINGVVDYFNSGRMRE